ncbi:MAG: hypothetical protein R3F12_11600 [Lysobacteraceae bacterium]
MARRRADLTDTLGAGLTYVSSSNGGVNAGQTTTWTSLAVPANGSLLVTVTASVDSPVSVTQVSNLAKPRAIQASCEQRVRGDADGAVGDGDEGADSEDGSQAGIAEAGRRWCTRSR